MHFKKLKAAASISRLTGPPLVREGMSVLTPQLSENTFDLYTVMVYVSRPRCEVTEIPSRLVVSQL